MYSNLNFKLTVYDSEFLNGRFFPYFVQQLADWEFYSSGVNEVRKDIQQSLKKDGKYKIEFQTEDQLKNIGVNKIDSYFSADYSRVEKGNFEFYLYYDNEYERGCYLKYGVKNTNDFYYAWYFGFDSSDHCRPYYHLFVNIKIEDEDRLKELLFDPAYPQIKPHICLKVSPKTLEQYLNLPTEISFIKLNSSEINYWLQCHAYWGREVEDYEEEEYDNSRERLFAKYWKVKANVKSLFSLSAKYNNPIRKKLTDVHLKEPCPNKCHHIKDLFEKFAFYYALETEEPFLFIRAVMACPQHTENIVMDGGLFAQYRIKFKDPNSPEISKNKIKIFLNNPNKYAEILNSTNDVTVIEAIYDKVWNDYLKGKPKLLEELAEILIKTVKNEEKLVLFFTNPNVHITDNMVYQLENRNISEKNIKEILLKTEQEWVIEELSSFFGFEEYYIEWLINKYEKSQYPNIYHKFSSIKSQEHLFKIIYILRPEYELQVGINQLKEVDLLNNLKSILTTRIHDEPKYIPYLELVKRKLVSSKTDFIDFPSDDYEFSMLQNAVNTVSDVNTRSFYQNHVNAMEKLKGTDFIIFGSMDGLVRFWNIRTRRVEKFFICDGGIKCFKITSDQSILTTGCENGVIQIWDLINNIHLATLLNPITLKKRHGNLQAINSIEISNDNSTLYAAREFNQIDIWNLKDKVLIDKISLPNHSIRKIHLDTNLNRLIVNGLVFNTRTHKEEHQLPGLFSIANLGPNHLIGLGSKQFFIFDRNTLEKKSVVNAHTHNIFVFAVSFKDKLLFTASVDHSLFVWNISDLYNPQLISELRQFKYSFVNLVIHDNKLIGIDTNGKISIFDIHTLRHEGGFEGYVYQNKNLIFLNNGLLNIENIRISLNSQYLCFFAQNQILILNCIDLNIVQKIELKNSNIIDVSFDDNGSAIAIMERQSIKIIELKSEEYKVELNFKFELPSAMRLCQDKLYFGRDDGQIYLKNIDKPNSKPVHLYDNGNKNLTHLEVNFNRTKLIFGYEDGIVQIFDLSKGKIIYEFDSMVLRLKTLELNKDDTILKVTDSFNYCQYFDLFPNLEKTKYNERFYGKQSSKDIEVIGNGEQIFLKYTKSAQISVLNESLSYWKHLGSGIFSLTES